MKDFVHRRCHNHNYREAAALCSECKKAFCRECITEHDDRMICASCLEALLKPRSSRRFHLSDILAVGQSALGLFITWLVFYYLAQTLLSLPSSFHEGTIWQAIFPGVR
jgi:hypothetical protein